MTQKVTPFLWFDGKAEEAMNLYVSVFPNAKIESVQRQGPNGPVMSGTFSIDGVKFHAFNGGPMFKFTEAISLMVDVETQAEVDAIWAKLTADGGAESRCGWLKDKFGVSWQIVPRALLAGLRDPDPAKAQRVVQAMMGMNKIDIAAIEKARAGT